MTVLSWLGLVALAVIAGLTLIGALVGVFLLVEDWVVRRRLTRSSRS